MDVSKDGLTILWLRTMWLANRHQRARVNKFHDKWIKQVKLSEKALAEAKTHERL